MKKYLLITIITFMSISLAACGRGDNEPAANNSVSGSQNQELEQSDVIDFDAISISSPVGNNAASPIASSSSDNAVSSSTVTTLPALSGQSDLASQYKKAILHTNYGDITLELYGSDSPKTVNNFLNLAQSGFYDGVKFHRVIKGFMIQGGDPNSKDDDWSNDGQGGPGYMFEDEFNSHKLVRGSIAMANYGANYPGTNGSQFFIVTADATPYLDGVHTNFGRVIAGLEVVDLIEKVETNENDHPTKDVAIESVELVK